MEDAVKGWLWYCRRLAWQNLLVCVFGLRQVAVKLLCHVAVIKLPCQVAVIKLLSQAAVLELTRALWPVMCLEDNVEDDVEDVVEDLRELL